MHLRGPHRRLPPRRRRPGPGPPRPHRPRRRHRLRPRHRPGRTRSAGHRARRPGSRRKRPPTPRTGVVCVRRPLRLVGHAPRTGAGMTHISYDDLRADTVRQVAKLMAAAAITAPKSGGQLLAQGKPLFLETVIIDDRTTLSQLAAWMRARGRERRENIWFRDAEAADAIDA